MTDILGHRLTRRATPLGMGAALASPTIRGAFAQAAPIKVCVLHSLSGTTAISESALRDTVLMMVEGINRRGGLLGRRVEAVVVDPASNWPLFAEKARELLQVAKVDAPCGYTLEMHRNHHLSKPVMIGAVMENG